MVGFVRRLLGLHQPMTADDEPEEFHSNTIHRFEEVKPIDTMLEDGSIVAVGERLGRVEQTGFMSFVMPEFDAGLTRVVVMDRDGIVRVHEARHEILQWVAARPNEPAVQLHDAIVQAGGFDPDVMTAVGPLVYEWRDITTPYVVKHVMKGFVFDLRGYVHALEKRAFDAPYDRTTLTGRVKSASIMADLPGLSVALARSPDPSRSRREMAHRPWLAVNCAAIHERPLPMEEPLSAKAVAEAVSALTPPTSPVGISTIAWADRTFERGSIVPIRPIELAIFSAMRPGERPASADDLTSLHSVMPSLETICPDGAATMASFLRVRGARDTWNHLTHAVPAVGSGSTPFCHVFEAFKDASQAIMMIREILVLEVVPRSAEDEALHTFVTARRLVAEDGDLEGLLHRCARSSQAIKSLMGERAVGDWHDTDDREIVEVPSIAWLTSSRHGRVFAVRKNRLILGFLEDVALQDIGDGTDVEVGRVVPMYPGSLTSEDMAAVARWIHDASKEACRGNLRLVAGEVTCSDVRSLCRSIMAPSYASMCQEELIMAIHDLHHATSRAVPKLTA